MGSGYALFLEGCENKIVQNEGFFLNTLQVFQHSKGYIIKCPKQVIK